MPGHAFGFGYGAGGSARRHGRRSAGAPPSTPALPALGNIVGHFNSSDPASLPEQADNSARGLWMDIASGISAAQATAASRPRYRAAGGAGINGQPYLQFDGTDDFLLIASPDAIKAAVDLREYTAMAVVNGCTSGGSNGTVLGDSGGGGGFALKALASFVGPPNELLGNRTGLSGTDYRAFSVGGTSTDDVAPSGNLRRFAYRGLTYTTRIEEPPATNGSALAIGARPAGDLRFAGNLYIDGDSRNAGIGTDTGTFGYSAGLAGRIETGVGAAPGTLSQHAIGSNNIAKCITKGAEIDALAQLIERHFPGTRHRLFYEEFFNSRSLALGDPSMANSFAGQTRQYVTDRRTGMPADLKIVGQTPIDHANVTSNNPQPGLPDGMGWPEYLMAHYPDLGFDMVADVWGTTELGGSNDVYSDSTSYTTASGRTLGDGIHLTTIGQGIQGACVAAACLALPGW